MSQEFDDLLRTAFPASTDQEVFRVVTEGVGLADDVRRNTPWLLNLIGDDLRGTLRRAATIFRFEQASKEGTLPFHATEVENTNGTSHLLKISAGQFYAHIVRTESDNSFPRHAPIRQDNRLRNQGDLFDDPKIVSLAEITPKISTMYAWMTFNADRVGAITHICWCMPEWDKNTFLGKINIMRSGLGDIRPEAPNPVSPDPTSRMKFKEFLDGAIESYKKKTD